MKTSRVKISIYSEDPDRLIKFYEDAFGFKTERKIDIPNDYGYFIKLMDNVELFIGKHSLVQGKLDDSLRHIFDLQVPSVNKAFEKVKKNGDIHVVAEPYEAPCSWAATFLDPEGNCWQLSGNK